MISTFSQIEISKQAYDKHSIYTPVDINLPCAKIIVRIFHEDGYVKLYITVRVISYDGAAYRNQLNAKDDQSKKRYPWFCTLVTSTTEGNT